MRSLLLLSAIIAITACSDNAQSTSPVRAASAPGEVAASAQRSPSGVWAFGKPAGSGPTITVVIGTTVVLPAGGSAISFATCPAGTSVTGGGYEYFTLGTDASVWRNRQLESQSGLASGWTVGARNTAAGAQAGTLTAWVSCAS